MYSNITATLLVLCLVEWMRWLACASQGGKFERYRASTLDSVLLTSQISQSNHSITHYFIEFSTQVLSAAHCQGVSNFVTLGMHKIKLSAGEADEFYNLEHIPIALDAIHPQYNGNTNANDFWAIKLQWASKLYANQVVVLDAPTDGVDLKSGDDLVTFGFGTLTSGGTTPNIMQEVTIDYITNADCVNSYGYASNEIDASMICAGRAGKDSCQVIICLFFLDIGSKSSAAVDYSTHTLSIFHLI